MLRTKWRILTTAAVLVFAAAWCVPVIEVPPLFLATRNAPADAMYGWQAIGMALRPVLEPTRPVSVVDMLAQVGSVLSALSNILFVAVAGSLLFRRAATPTMRVEVTMWIAIAVNMLWLGPDASHLRAGYYLWLLSFVVLALAVRERRQVGQSSKDALLAPAV